MSQAMAAVQEPPSACPMHGAPRQAAPLQPQDELAIPLHKRLFAFGDTNPDGTATLHLSFGEQDIRFDDPTLFGFAQGLCTHARFRAAEAVSWGPGLDWGRVQPLLQTLVDAGLVSPADTLPQWPAQARGRVASPLPPATCTRARDWREGESLMQELTGRALAPGWLELVVPVYRVAHAMLDTEGRQVGEANVFPAPLRLDIPTEWRVCNHAGSRYQDPQPMNVSALRSMVQHWKPAMALLAQLRQAYVQRFPQAAQRMTIGHLQRFTTLVLALPAWLMQRADQPVANGHLDPVLSSLFRVTDGVRMVMHRMLFTADHEPARPATAPIDAAGVLAYAERNTAFLSDHGVCAGPKLMIEEFLRVLVDGGTVGEVDGLGPQVQEALSRLDEVFDYGLLGLQAYALVFALWPRMARSYESVMAALDHPAMLGLPAAQAWREVLRPAAEHLRDASRVRDEPRRHFMEAAYADMYAACAVATGQPADLHSLGQRLDAVGAVAQGGARGFLLQTLQRRCPGASPAQQAVLNELADHLVLHWAHEQAVLREASAVQARINRLLGRAQPPQPLVAADLALHYRLVAHHYQADEVQRAGGRLPSLDDDVVQALGLHLEVDAGSITILDLVAAPPNPTRSAGGRPDPRAMGTEAVNLGASHGSLCQDPRRPSDLPHLSPPKPA
ncbi:hypothetical protein BurJ1DRAFT_1513 [Burkholderiales bacterium JOSHI_001]|nr:hypothetical protein BurJ1DRAFT_1513 [Burkholderiales bacterium JOSHI_001]